MYVHIAHCRLTQLLFNLVFNSLNVASCQSTFHKKNDRLGIEMKQENLVRGSVEDRQGEGKRNGKRNGKGKGKSKGKSK